MSINNNGSILGTNQPDPSVGGLRATPENYTSLANLIDPTKPDVRDLYVQTYGDQGITGFLELTGAKKNAGTSDKVEWYEEGRLHKTVAYTALGAAATDTNAQVTLDATKVRLNDVLLLETGKRCVVIGKLSDNSGVEVVVMDGSAIGSTSSGTAAIIGNVYGQGTNQPEEFYNTGLIKRENPYIITKEMYEVNGSQATNIGWLNVNGQYMWYLKNEMDARKRFMNQREMMLLYSQLDVSGASPALLDLAGDSGDTTLTNVGGSVGSEGYFQAVEQRGITTTGVFASTDFDDIDILILELDKEGAPGEYAMYLNRQTSLDIDDMLANGGSAATSAGLAGQFGAFNNSKDMAVSLGFKSFTRGGYTFHKHDWKLLNDPTLTVPGSDAIRGAMIPMSQVADANTGIKSPALELNYKSAGNYSREMEHWVEGGGVLGHVTSGKDTVKFNYRSECNLVTRAANQHILLK
jgi:hypothetical protein|tara:strand:- start:2872 stop:4266 length:1395 start_codon:yes stop_codon:yes gene_type:complete